MSYIGASPGQVAQNVQPAVDYFNGDGTTVAFTLSRAVTQATQLQVWVNSVNQNPSSAYSVLNKTITFTSAPSAGTNNIYVYYVTQYTAASGTVTSPTSGATGGGTDSVFIQNGQTINYSYTVPAGLNAMSTGPIAISANATVTVSDGSVWAII